MCGRYALFSKKEQIAKDFGIVKEPEISFEPHYNISPGMTAPIVLVGKDNQKMITELKWGLIPPWADDSNIGYKMINARSETVAEKRSFSAPFQRKRCIIPVNGFYEWRKFGSTKLPFYITVNSCNLFGFAGIFEKWKSPDGTVTPTFSILTTEANTLLKPLHERMPVILDPQEYNVWLDNSEYDEQLLMGMLNQYPMSDMSVYPVSPLVNKAENNSPELIQPIEQ